jgi:hypothetical protein
MAAILDDKRREAFLKQEKYFVNIIQHGGDDVIGKPRIHFNRLYSMQSSCHGYRTSQACANH